MSGQIYAFCSVCWVDVKLVSFYYAVAASVCEEQGNFLAFLTRMHHIDH